MADTSAVPPNPGSAEAVALGCTCPVIDNAFGAGYMGRSKTFVFTCGCPLHCPLPAEVGSETTGAAP